MDKVNLWRKWFHFCTRFGKEYNGGNEKSGRVGEI